MKPFPLIALCCGLLLSGCDSGLSDDIRSELGPREAPKTKVFQADQKAVYAAARRAVDDMEFHFEHGGPAEGRIEAHSAITGGDDTATSARQISMKVNMEPESGGGTSVEVSLTEILSADPTNKEDMATQTPLRDTPLYDVFFKDIQRYLQVDAKE
jgi:hypothetical protein